jgi:Cu(I)/Ag(I) efflux system membrane fusion protein
MATEHPHEEPAIREGEEAPPPGVRTMAIVRWVILAVTIVAAAASTFAYFRGGHATTQQGEPKFYCPMHPQITSDVRGECPICHMTLEPIPPERLKGGVVVPEAPSSSAAPAAADGGSVPNRAAVTLSFDRVQAIGVKVATAVSRELSLATRITASVAAPEQGAASVHTRSPGYVERIRVQETGVKVTKGQELVAIYSPEIYQAQAELLAARGWGSADSGVSSPARQKLELLGMSGADIDRVLATGKPVRAVSIVAPTSGYVAKKNVVLGSFVTPEMDLYEIVDLSRVYILADVPEGALGTIKEGTVGRFTKQGEGAEPIEAKVDLIYPSLNLEARTTRVRMVVKNTKLALRPGEFGVVEFATAPRRALVVPRDAVVDTGARTYVYVEGGNGRYTPRSVVVGAEAPPEVEIIEGLSPGERVVSGATFMIDSESALQASVAAPGSSAPTGCGAQFDQAKFPDKFAECQKCEIVHRGMGTMVDDCKNAIPKPWK